MSEEKKIFQYEGLTNILRFISDKKIQSGTFNDAKSKMNSRSSARMVENNGKEIVYVDEKTIPDSVTQNIIIRAQSVGIDYEASRPKIEVSSFLKYDLKNQEPEFQNTNNLREILGCAEKCGAKLVDLEGALLNLGMKRSESLLVSSPTNSRLEGSFNLMTFYFIGPNKISEVDITATLKQSSRNMEVLLKFVPIYE